MFLFGSFPLPWYQSVPLSLALSPRIYKEVKNFKPDIIHASSPGVMVSLPCCLDCSECGQSDLIVFLYIHSLHLFTDMKLSKRQCYENTCSSPEQSSSALEYVSFVDMSLSKTGLTSAYYLFQSGTSEARDCTSGRFLEPSSYLSLSGFQL